MKRSSSVTLKGQFDYLKKDIQKRTSCPQEELHELNKSLGRFFSEFKKRWSNVHRIKERFLEQNKLWLDSSVGFINYRKRPHADTLSGRPETTFNECSDRSKRRKTQDLRKTFTHDELAFATQMNLRQVGQLEAAKLIKEVTQTSPTRALKYRRAFKAKQQHIKEERISAEEALSMIMDAKLTRHQYNIVRSKAKKVFPNYKIIQSAKKSCYPRQEDVKITISSAEIKLQALLDLTAHRILEAQKEVIQGQGHASKIKLILISKWGFDGSSGLSEYKQKAGEVNDASVFMTSLVPIKLVSNKNQDQILWQNPRTSSTRFCRPVRFQFTKETTELSVTEKEHIEAQIRTLSSTKLNIYGIDIEILHTLLFTMVDGKVCNAVTGTTSTLKCYICGLSAKDFNNLEKVDAAPLNRSNYEFGLSTLHGWIRCFECLLHLSYKLPLKTWQARGREAKEIVSQRKSFIQSEFKKKLSLLVDKPKPGFGSTNDGNTARRFFQNAETSAEITGINLKIIKRFYIILQTISSGYKINVEKFQAYTRETATIFIQNYSWYAMPPSIHKILIHGPEIINNALLPIGQLSEEAQEARNKDFKLFRRAFSRRFTREETNEDILNVLLVSSDPLISSLHPMPKRKLNSFSSEVLQLLNSPDIKLQEEEGSNDEWSDEEDTEQAEESKEEELYDEEDDDD